MARKIQRNEAPVETAPVPPVEKAPVTAQQGPATVVETSGQPLLVLTVETGMLSLLVTDEKLMIIHDGVKQQVIDLGKKTFTITIT